MKSIEIQKIADLIWSDIFSKENSEKPRSIQVKLIEKRLMPFYNDARKIGRTQVINHISEELKRLK